MWKDTSCFNPPSLSFRTTWAIDYTINKPHVTLQGTRPRHTRRTRGVAEGGGCDDTSTSLQEHPRAPSAPPETRKRQDSFYPEPQRQSGLDITLIVEFQPPECSVDPAAPSTAAWVWWECPALHRCQPSGRSKFLAGSGCSVVDLNYPGEGELSYRRLGHLLCRLISVSTKNQHNGHWILLFLLFPTNTHFGSPGTSMGSTPRTPTCTPHSPPGKKHISERNGSVLNSVGASTHPSPLLPLQKVFFVRLFLLTINVVQAG
nr:uncharacterized protein LOC129526223 [Gorilla gorilla gorilla]